MKCLKLTFHSNTTVVFVKRLSQLRFEIDGIVAVRDSAASCACHRLTNLRACQLLTRWAVECVANVNGLATLSFTHNCYVGTCIESSEGFK